MRARWLVALFLTTAASAVFDWRTRGHGPLVPARRSGSTEWLADAHARAAAAPTLAYLVEMIVEVPGEDPVVFQEAGAFDEPRRRRWHTVEIGHGDETLPPIRLLAVNDEVWVAPGHVGEHVGVDPRGWIGASVGSLDRLGQRRWRDGLPGSGRVVRDLALKAVGDAVVVGREEIRGAPTTHVRPWVDDPGVPGVAGGGPVDVWVDDDSRLRKVEYVAPSTAAVAAGGTGLSNAPSRVTLRLELFDYGVPVDA